MGLTPVKGTILCLFLTSLSFVLAVYSEEIFANTHAVLVNYIINSIIIETSVGISMPHNLLPSAITTNGFNLLSQF
jgi:hypothetical protein